MKTVLTVLVVLGLASTLGVLLTGMLGLVRNNGSGERSNTLMRWRVVLQGATLALLALLLLLSRL
jgi:hypothetical protein